MPNNPIVVAIDFAEMTDFVLGEAIKQAALRSTSIHVVCSIDPSLDVTGAGIHFDDELAKLAEALEARVADPVTDAGLSSQTHARLGPPASEIVAVAREVGAQLIVVGRHSRAGGAAVLGSVPAKILALARCSVLVVHPVDHAG